MGDTAFAKTVSPRALPATCNRHLMFLGARELCVADRLSSIRRYVLRIKLASANVYDLDVTTSVQQCSGLSMYSCFCRHGVETDVAG